MPSVGQTKISDYDMVGPTLRITAKATMLVSLVERADITKRKDVEELWITDRLGNVRFKQKYNAGQKNVSINISPLPPGIYAVVASHGKSQVSEKFIKE